MKFTIILAFFTAISSAVFSQQSAQITGEGQNLKNGDTVACIVSRHGISDYAGGVSEVLHSIVKNHRFNFAIQGISTICEVSMNVDTGKYVPLLGYYVTPGDDIQINFEKSRYLITGTKSTFYNLQDSIRKIELNSHLIHPKPNNLRAYFENVQLIAQAQMRYLQQTKSRLSTLEENFLARRIEESPKYYTIYQYDWYSRTNIADNFEFRDSYREVRDKLQLKSFDEELSTPDEIQCRFEAYKIDSCFMVGKAFSLARFLEYANAMNDNSLKERLITYAIISQTSYKPDDSREIEKSLNAIKNPVFKSALIDVLSNTIDGATAFNFQLTNTKGEKVRLSDFKGMPVVLDFWFTGCGACRILAPYMKKVKSELSGRKIKFVSISIDKNKQTWLKSIATESYTSLDNENLFTNGNGDQDECIRKYKVIGYPTLYLIDRNGKIVNIKVLPVEDDGKSIIEQIKKLL